MAHLSLDAKGGQWLADLAGVGPKRQRRTTVASWSSSRPKAANRPQTGFDAPAREILGLYYDEGLTMSQIGERLGLNRSTVCRTIHRARERLYRSLRFML